MRHVSADQIAQCLDYPALVKALDQAFAADYIVPPRHHHAISPTATQLLMPAWSAGTPRSGAFLGTKLVNVFSGNGALGLPSIAGLYILQSGETGIPLCVMDGAALTAKRTAAVSALAASRLARKDAQHLVMVGAGALAPELIAAHSAVRSLRKITLWNRNPASSENLKALIEARLLQGSHSVEVEIGTDLGACVACADIVSVATLAQFPIIKGEWIKRGTHVDLVGAFNMEMREADDAALRVSSIFIDTLAAKTEGGDVALGLKSGAITEANIKADLFSLARGLHEGRKSEQEITLFKSVGSAISDLAAAMLVWQRLNGSQEAA